ncbi:MAG: hypothetical protein QJR13_00065 [Bacillota bacterium]|nr:hypothetical protein [Bacillota bacterium]
MENAGVKRWMWPAATAVLAVLLLAGLLGYLPFQRVRLGVIDISRIVNESARAKRYQEQLNRRYEELVSALKQEKDPQELQRKREAAYAEYQRFKEQLEQKLNREVDAAVRQVARRRRLTAVLFKESVRYGGEEITDEVISLLK